MNVSEGLTHVQTDEVTVELKLSLFDDMDGSRLILFNLSTKTTEWVDYCMTLFKGEISHFCSTSRTKQMYDLFSNYYQPLINIRNVSNSYPSPNSHYWFVWLLEMFKQNRNATLHL